MPEQYDFAARGRTEAEYDRLREEYELARQRGEMLDAHNLLHQMHSLEQDIERQTRDPRRCEA